MYHVFLSADAPHVFQLDGFTVGSLQSQPFGSSIIIMLTFMLTFLLFTDFQMGVEIKKSPCLGGFQVVILTRFELVTF